MGLTLFTYLAALGMIIGALRFRGIPGNHDTLIFRLAILASILYAVTQASGYTLAARQPGVALVLVRLAACGAASAFLIFLRLSISYPRGRRLILVDLALFLAIGWLVWRILFSDAYIMAIQRIQLDYIRTEGPEHRLFSSITAIAGVLAALIFASRSFFESNRVFRQQLRVIATGLAISISFGYIVAIYLPNRGLSAVYPLASANGLFSVLVIGYAFNQTRLFTPTLLVKNGLNGLASFLLFAVPSGAVAGYLLTLHQSGQIQPAVVAVLAMGGFIIAGLGADSLTRGLAGSARNIHSIQGLEAAIANLDLSTGRDAVLVALEGLLVAQFGCTSFEILSENDHGSLVRIHPTEDDTATAAADSPILQALNNLDTSVILKTDLDSVPTIAASRMALSLFFEALCSEAIVLAREGRRVIGVFSLGPKRNGTDYNILDFEALNALLGKLFVIAYYARHVAREALMATVEQEIVLADHIVRSIQSNVDPIIHPHGDAAFICRSMRQIGGDLYDSIRLSDQRWFFVVGDVSGKGLNASMSMMILKSMIRTLLREERNFRQLVSRTNAFIRQHLPRGTFFAGVFGFIALDKGTIHFINCGIPAIFFRSPALDAIIEVQGEGHMLGFVNNIEPFLKTRRLQLTAGSSLLFSTDGILEAENIRGERYGKERLVHVISENKTAGAQATVAAIINSVSAFTNDKIDDDTTVLVLKYTGIGERQQ
jgi:serine phosphatase RsbU (regulator of sigma subunit)